MSAKSRTSWFWSDWSGDQAVRRLTPAERGMWIDLLALAAVGNPTGYVCDAQGRALPLEEIARFANCTVEEASELIVGILEKGAGSRDRTGRLFNRRSVREAELSAKRKAAGTSGGAATRAKWKGLTAYNNSTKLPLPQQVPQHGRSPPSYPIKKTCSSSNSTAREASAARSESGGRDGKPNGPRPSDLSRADFDAMFEKKRDGKEPH